MASRPRRSKAKPAAVKSKPTPCGIEVLTQDEIDAVGRGEPVNDEHKQRIFGLVHGVRHPSRTTGEDAKGGGQKWNPNCFMGLGWKSEKEGRRGKEKQSAGFESALVRPTHTPYGGLKNHGATCYMNSMLQCLFFNMPFRKGIMQLQEGRGLQPGVTAGEGFKPITELQKIFSHLQLSQARSCDPKPFIDGLKLSTSVQQDAQEFMKMYLTYIENELSKHSGIPPQLRNLVQDNFSGKYAYCTTCKECNTRSPNEVPFYDLDLKVQGIKSLEESLDDFFKEDELTGDNKYQCSACDKKTEARRGIELLGLPAVLNLQLLRFVYDVNSNSRRKVSSFVNFPKELDLSKWLKRSKQASSVGGGKRRKTASSACSDAAEESDGSAAAGGCIYDLEAIVLHTGASAVQGHYVAHVKHPQTSVWLRFDDEHVSSLEDDEYFGNADALAKAQKKRKPEERDGMEGRVKSRDAYMLIYRRRAAHGDACAAKTVEDECGKMVPGDWRAGISEESEELMKQAKVAEETYNSSTSRRAIEQTEKQEVWDILPDDEQDGFWVGTDWLKHWISMDPQEKCDKIDTCPITSAYGKADPLKVHEMKLISKAAFQRLRQKHGITGGSVILERKDMCELTIKNECERRSKSQSTKTIVDALKQCLAVIPNSSEAGAHWISKLWCKERITAAVKGDKQLSGHPLGHEVYCSEICGRSREGDSRSSGSQMEACPGGRLTPDKSKRRLVTREFVDFLKQNWREGDQPAMVPASEDECATCAAKAQKEDADREVIKNERKRWGQEFKAVLGWSPIKLKPGATYYLLHYAWVQKFQNFVELPEIRSLEVIDNLPLMTDSGDKLAVDPGDLSPLEQAKFLWLEESDWKKLHGLVHGGPEIMVSPQLEHDRDGLRDVLVNRLPPKSSQVPMQLPYVPCVCNPAMCEITIQNAKKWQQEQLLNYTDAKITITRHSASASAIAQPASNGIAASAGPAAGGGSRRGRPRKGEVQVTVSSTTTVKAVKLQIYEKLHFSPAEQKLMYGSKELEEGEKTLGEYEVPRDADVRLHIISSDCDVDETGARIKGKGQREVDAGFSGTLLSGFGLDSSSNDNELIVVPDSLDAMEKAVQSSTGDQQVIAATISLVEDEGCASVNGHKDSEEKGRQGASQRKSRRKKDSEEHRTVLGERPTETKRQRRPPSSYDPEAPKENSQPSGVRKGGRSRASSGKAPCKVGTSQEEICCVEDEDVDTQKAIAASMDSVTDTDLQEALAASLAGSK